MQQHDYEKISLMLDDELDPKLALSLLKATKQDADLQAKLRRYAMISQALKHEQCLVAAPGFADRIHQKLKPEPNYLLPRPKSLLQSSKPAIAVAASLFLAVVGLSMSLLQKQNLPFAENNVVAQRSVQTEQANARFKEYLQAHDNAWYVNNNAGVKTYTRMASYQQK